MLARRIAPVLLCVVIARPVVARPLARYVFDRGGTQYDLGSAPAANATLSTNAAPVYSSPNAFSCAALNLTVNGANHNYATTGADVTKLDALSAMTVTLWVNLQGNPASDDCLASDMAPWGAPAGQGGWELRIMEHEGVAPTASNFRVAFGVGQTTGGYAYVESQNSEPLNAANRWVFVAVTYDYEPFYQGYIVSYYTGTDAGAVAKLGIYDYLYEFSLLENAAEFRLGSASSEPNTDRTPPAWIDDVRVYNRALSLAELEQVRLENVVNSQLGITPAFFGIGSLPGFGCASWAAAVSGDGSTVVGQAITAPIVRPFRWKNGVIEAAVNQPANWTRGTAMEVSTDGSVVVGWGSVTSYLSDYRSFRWEGNQVTVLDPLPGGDGSGWAYSCAGDGSVVVGTSSGYGYEPFRWENGVTQALPTAAGTQGYAMDISPDGQVIVGVLALAIGDYRAFRLENGILEELSPVPQPYGFDSRIRISANKQAVVGWAQPNSVREAVIWRAGRTFGLSDLPGGAVESEATAVSRNASRVVGTSRIGPTESAAFLWDRTHGMRNLKEVLSTEYGFDMEGWRMTWATGISDDGTTIVGHGINPAGNTDGWLARLPAPLPATDLDGSGHVDGGDVERFAACVTGPEVPYSGGNVPPECSPGLDTLGLLPADLDWDGDVDQDDFAVLQLCISAPGASPPAECQG